MISNSNRLKGFFYLAVLSLALAAEHLAAQQQRLTVRVATFNVSIEANNYSANDELNPAIVQQHLASGDFQQLKNIAEIIQRVRPDILLLNEFDYIENADQGIIAFVKNYLNQSQGDVFGIEYPHWYVAPVNTGLPSPFDLDNDGSASRFGADAWGYGLYPGQYGMALISRYPIEKENVRTLQNFLWKDMPNALITTLANGQPWYSEEEWSQMPLSSKSHWDIPVTTPSGTIHIVAAHPTPPTF
ncbi:MAG: endonuclease/exonuclease/phosphatase family protein, partial [Acidiferrobacterales bacterium]|nr:endonuclease/exonuclease/phosphatase family protein [Acidiferrobacterales bacterium]